MDFARSKNETLLALWESVRQQVLMDQVIGNRNRLVGENARAYAGKLCSEMDRRRMSYEPIEWRAEI